MNTAKLKPKKTEVCLIYVCPKCEQEWHQSIKETKFPGGVLCYCDAELSFLPVTKVNVELKYKDDKDDKEYQEEKEEKEEKDFEEVVVSLTNLGFKKSEARKLVKEFTSEKDYSSSEELCEDIFSRGI